MEDEKLLLADHQHFSESFWKSEELGERRVNFFITITTAVLIGIVSLLTSKIHDTQPDKINKIISFALSGNLIFGLLTFVRILRRNRVTDEYKKILDYLRKEIVNRSLSLSDYKLPFKESKGRKNWFRGGLAETVAVMNAILFSVLLEVWFQNWWSLFITFIVALIPQLLLVRGRLKVNL